MSSAIIYLDESGDLGWNFDKLYRNGGSSRYLTIASLIVDPSQKHLPKRLIKKLYDKFKWTRHIEKKWSKMKQYEREHFAKQAASMHSKNKNGIRYMAITVRKENVQVHLRSDPNKLYNYMICLLLLNEMSKHKNIIFIPDPRSIKIKSGNSLHDYLQTKLWFEKQVVTSLNTQSITSSSSLSIQFADMLAGLVQGHFEDDNSNPWGLLKNHISYKTLFF